MNFEHFIDPVLEGYRMGSEQPLSKKSSQASFWSMPGNMQVSPSALVLSLCDGDDGPLPSWLAHWHPRARAIKLDSLPNTSLGTSSLLSRPTMIITTTMFITSANRITHKGYISIFTSAIPTTYFIYFYLSGCTESSVCHGLSFSCSVRDLLP